MKTHILVVSDIHVGSPVSRAKELIELLEKVEFDILLIDGDLFNDLAFTRLTKEDWKLLSYLRKLTKHARVIWVKGNHDDPVAEVVAHLLGIELVMEYEWEEGDEKYHAEHGDRFDHFINKYKTVTNVACAIYFTLQMMDKKTHRFSRFVKKVSKKWLRLSTEVATKALAYGEARGRHIICGHTHRMSKKKGEVMYYNSGCWTDIPSTFLTVDKHGVRMYNVDKDGEIEEEK